MGNKPTPSQDDKIVGAIGQAAVRNVQGRDFTYPFIGPRVRNYLAQ